MNDYFGISNSLKLGFIKVEMAPDLESAIITFNSK